MAHWLMKSEPGSYSWDDLVRDGGTEWDGVRNPAARLHLRAMKPGDEAFFYHSGGERSVVGIMRIVRDGRPDPDDPDWVSVRVEPLLAKMELIRQSRLSVAPVRDEEWSVLLRMAEPGR
jgi:predicted RNA-binding protein with PUA-like domain